MKKATTLVAALATILIALPAFADQSASCGWEDGVGTVLGTNGNVGGTANVSLPDPVHTGARSLSAFESPLGGTPQLYLAFVEGLTDGDEITACFWAYDTTAGSPSMRIWAHYAQTGDVNSYSGSASGNGTYSDGTGWSTGWSQLCFTWTFDSGGNTRDAFVLEGRMYSGADLDAYWVDDLEISTTSDTATITTPCAGPVSVDESTWGQMKASYR